MRHRAPDGNIPAPKPLTRRRGATLRKLRGARAFAGLAVVGTALVLFGAGCGDDEPAAGEKPGEGETIRIAVNPWTGSAVNANVAKILLERELGYKVVNRDIAEAVLREIDGQASDRSMSLSCSLALLAASSYFSTPS